MRRSFHLVDVFGERPLSGNPLAVVSDAEGLETEQMVELTRWFNLSETTFLLPPQHSDADYRVRIFTLSGELPFAGHPTLGSCHIWARESSNESARMVQECGAGLVPLRREDGLLWFLAPPLVRQGEVDEETEEMLVEVLGVARDEIVATRWIDNGPGWVGALLSDAEAVLALQPDPGGRRGLDIGVIGFHPMGSPTAYEVRAFFTDHNGRLIEDPVTGSLNASAAKWLIEEGRVSPPYRASQGAPLGRSGIIHIDQDDEGIWVGGATHSIGSGRLDV